MQKVELNTDEFNLDSSRLTMADIVEHVLADAAPTVPHHSVPLPRERQLLPLSG
jgi:hypothetical protein